MFQRSPGPLDAHLDTVGILMAAPEPTQSPSSTTAWLGDSLKEAKNMNTSKLVSSSNLNRNKYLIYVTLQKKRGILHVVMKIVKAIFEEF